MSCRKYRCESRKLIEPNSFGGYAPHGILLIFVQYTPQKQRQQQRGAPDVDRHSKYFVVRQLLRIAAPYCAHIKMSRVRGIRNWSANFSVALERPLMLREIIIGYTPYSVYILAVATALPIQIAKICLRVPAFSYALLCMYVIFLRELN